MHNLEAPHNDQPTCAPEILALSSMGSQVAMRDRLLAIASQFGKVGEITALQGRPHAASDHDVFLVNFEDTSDAIVAARKLRCHLFGFSTVLVPVAHPSACCPTSSPSQPC